MDQEIKALWTGALRSGDYTQGQAYLNKNGQFCCLGVLCDLAEKAGIVESKRRVSGFGPKVVEYGNGYRFEMNMLPKSVVEWAGMDDISGSLPESYEGSRYGSDKVALWELNDIGEMNFSDIANIINENL